MFEGGRQSGAGLRVGNQIMQERAGSGSRASVLLF